MGHVGTHVRWKWCKNTKIRGHPCFTGEDTIILCDYDFRAKECKTTKKQFCLKVVLLLAKEHCASKWQAAVAAYCSNHIAAHGHTHTHTMLWEYMFSLPSTMNVFGTPQVSSHVIRASNTFTWPNYGLLPMLGRCVWNWWCHCSAFKSSCLIWIDLRALLNAFHKTWTCDPFCIFLYQHVSTCINCYILYCYHLISSPYFVCVSLISN